MELVHSHIALTPESPRRVADVPVQLSAIIMRLLAKSADARYQSAHGLLVDVFVPREGPLVRYHCNRSETLPVVVETLLSRKDVERLERVAFVYGSQEAARARPSSGVTGLR